MNRFKKTVSAITTHVKKHPAIYAYTAGAIIGITATSYAIGRNIDKVIDNEKAVSLMRIASDMRETGKGRYYDLGVAGTIIMQLNENLENPLTFD